MNELRLDEMYGTVVIDNRIYNATDISHTFTEQNKQMRLIIHTPDDDYLFEAPSKSFLRGYTDAGLLVYNYLQNIEKMKKISVNLAIRKSLQEGNIPHIDAPAGLLLKKGEYAIITDLNVRYCQERTKTTYHNSSARVRICKGVSIGGGQRIPVKEEYLATLDTGRLTLTNKRLIFSGDKKSATIQIPKIAAIEKYSDAISISKENAAKKIMFVNIDGVIYSDIIEAIFREN